ncbi:hypothetical protein IT417_03640 [bacterium]|nr:hypothetical protein [bacterium]
MAQRPGGKMKFLDAVASHKKNISPHQLMILLSQKAVWFASAILLLGVFSACSSTSETIIKDKKISLSTPEVIDTIHSTLNIPDTVWEKIKIQIPDTTRIEGKFTLPKAKEKGKVVYLPKIDTFIVYLPPQTVDTSIVDTTTHTTIKEANSPMDYLIYLIILAVVVAAVVIFLKLKR